MRLFVPTPISISESEHSVDNGSAADLHPLLQTAASLWLSLVYALELVHLDNVSFVALDRFAENKKNVSKTGG